MIEIQRYSAKNWYGSHATGSVLLHKGQVVIHASNKEVNTFIKDTKHKYKII